MNKICFGCGSKLQTTDKNKNGYVPTQKLEDAKYCMRCFRMNHYGEIQEKETPKDVKEIINKINKDYRHVIFLVDFLNLNKEVIKIFKSIKKRKILIINKCELIPKHINQDLFKKFIQEYYDIKDLIKLKGGSQSHGARSIMNLLEKEDIKESYILGISNSGKSTLINDLLELTDSKMNRVTVNSKANTTLDFIRVKFNDNLTLIDSPGFILPNSLNHDAYSKNITAYSFNMKAGETLSLLDNKYYFKFDSDTPIVFYTNVDSKKTIKKYFKAADGLTNEISVNGYSDIVLYGIGFITVKNKTGVTTNVDLKHIEIRDSMFGGNDE